MGRGSEADRERERSRKRRCSQRWAATDERAGGDDRRQRRRGQLPVPVGGRLERERSEHRERGRLGPSAREHERDEAEGERKPDEASSANVSR